MIWKIITSFFFVELLIAFVISMAWVANNIEPHSIKLSADFLAFLRNCNDELNELQILIPEIPKIDNLPTNDGVLGFVNFLIDFVNGISSLFNGFTMIINVILRLLEYIIVVLVNAIQLATGWTNADEYVSPITGVYL